MRGPRRWLTQPCVAAVLLAGGLALPGQAGEVDELVAAVAAGLDPAQLTEDGGVRFAEALAAAMAAGQPLDGEGLAGLRLRVAQAWWGAGVPQTAAQELAVVLADPDAGVWRDEAIALALDLDDARQRRGEEPWPGIADLVAAAPAALQARALHLDAQRRLEAGEAVEAVALAEAALTLLSEDPVTVRAPVFATLVLAKEASGLDSAGMAAWLREHAADPVLVHLGLRTQARPAPPLSGTAVGGGEIDLSTMRGRPVLVFFCASWSESSAPVARALAQALAQRPDWSLIIVSLDTAGTLGRLPGWLAEQGLEAPILAEGRGWDGSRDEDWQVAQIPTVFVVDPSGALLANDVAAAPDLLTAVDRTLAAAAPAPPPAEQGLVIP